MPNSVTQIAKLPVKHIARRGDGSRDTKSGYVSGDERIGEAAKQGDKVRNLDSAPMISMFVKARSTLICPPDASYVTVKHDRASGLNRFAAQKRAKSGSIYGPCSNQVLRNKGFFLVTRYVAAEFLRLSREF